MISNGGLIPRRRALSRYLGVLGGSVITAAAVALAGGMPVMAAAATAPAAGSGGWSGPRELPGPRVITESGIFTALSCTSRSDCTAVGFYLGTHTGRMFAVTERHGVWGRALNITAPTAAKNVSFGGDPVVSCASAGNCAAGDWYSVSGRERGFVIAETNGTWGKAREVRRNPTAISCPAPGDCTAVLAGGFLVSEIHGTWRKAFPVPGRAALRHGQPFNNFGAISCTSPGNCTAAGYFYLHSAASSRSFILTQRHGIWGKAQPVRSSSGAGLAVSALSCPTAGSCVAGGTAFPLAGSGFGPFAVTEVHGRWGTARSLPGTFKFRYGIGQLACTAAGECSAVGSVPPDQGGQALVSTETNGTWHSVQIITAASPGPAPLALGSLSCNAGGCVLAGDIVVRGGAQAAAAVQVNGRWGPARILPGVSAGSGIAVVSCPARSRCTAVGFLGEFSSGHLFAVVQR